MEKKLIEDNRTLEVEIQQRTAYEEKIKTQQKLIEEQRLQLQQQEERNSQQLQIQDLQNQLQLAYGEKFDDEYQQLRMELEKQHSIELDQLQNKVDDATNRNQKLEEELLSKEEQYNAQVH